MKRRRFYIARDHVAELGGKNGDWAVYDREEADESGPESTPLAVFRYRSSAQHMANELNAGRWGK